MRARTLAAPLAATLLLAACAGETTTTAEETTTTGATETTETSTTIAASTIEIHDPQIPQPAGENGALYLHIVNTGTADDRVVGAATDVAATVELHETVMDGDVMTMRPVEGYDVPAGGSVTLERGGKHIMLLGVEPLEVGDVVTVELQFERAGVVVVEAEVVPQVATTPTTMGM